MSIETVEPVAAPAEKIPPWLWLVFGAAIGAVVTFGALAPSVTTPEYQRGHAGGYKTGYREKEQQFSELSKQLSRSQ
jgi:hypothetical protein